MVLPLILQPLVENSVIHGLRNKEGEGTINISVQRERQEVRLVVEDDGVGINLETIKAVLAQGPPLLLVFPWRMISMIKTAIVDDELPAIEELE